MNIENFKPINYTWPEIFQLQKQLNYEFIPEMKEITENFDINVYEDQEVFRKMCWKITEELTEAFDAYLKADLTHAKEEAIDALNFLIELYGMYGWEFNDMVDIEGPSILKSLETQILYSVFILGMCANKLKSRQWRQSQYMVDLELFEPILKNLWERIHDVLFTLGVSSDKEIRELWSLKFQVNKFRLESKY